MMRLSQKLHSVCDKKGDPEQLRSVVGERQSGAEGGEQRLAKRSRSGATRRHFSDKARRKIAFPKPDRLLVIFYAGIFLTAFGLGRG